METQSGPLIARAALRIGAPRALCGLPATPKWIQSLQCLHVLPVIAMAPGPANVLTCCFFFFKKLSINLPQLLEGK